jgi:hypothetical protein
MPRDSTVIAFRQPETIDDPLTEVAREGARRTSVRPCSSRSAPPNRGAFFLAWRKQKVDATQIQNRRDSTSGHEHAFEPHVWPVQSFLWRCWCFAIVTAIDMTYWSADELEQIAFRGLGAFPSRCECERGILL